MIPRIMNAAWIMMDSIFQAGYGGKNGSVHKKKKSKKKKDKKSV